MNNQIDETIVKYSKELRLPVFRRDFKELSKQAATERTDYEEFLLRLMEREFELRAENRKKAQIRQACFPSKMYLSDLQREQLPVDANEKLPLLERLDFIETGQILYWPEIPEPENTHAVGLGLKACSGI